jgi:hypothetical protein
MMLRLPITSLMPKARSTNVMVPPALVNRTPITPIDRCCAGTGQASLTLTYQMRSATCTTESEMCVSRR